MFYGLKIALTSDVQNKQKQNETLKFSKKLFLTFISNNMTHKKVVLKSLSKMKLNGKLAYL